MSNNFIMTDAKNLNENLLPLRCYYCNRFISSLFLMSATPEELKESTEQLKTCCNALIGARRKS